jgi:hypothetical protein
MKYERNTLRLLVAVGNLMMTAPPFLQPRQRNDAIGETA